MRAICGSLLSLAMSVAAIEAQTARQPVAIVALLSGTATARSASGEEVPLRLFTRIEPTTVVRVADNARVMLAFASGKRFELGGGARATVAADALTDTAGPVKALPSAPPLPRLALLEGKREAPRAGAIRIRGATVTGLYPHANAATLGDRTTLRFDPVESASAYKVEVEDERGVAVFEAETDTSSVTISPGVLRPGKHYYWRVKAVMPTGPSARGESEFVTLSSEDAARRDALRQELLRSGDAAAAVLAAEIDRSLGLLAEAVETLRGLPAETPSDLGIAATLAEIERQVRTP